MNYIKFRNVLKEVVNNLNKKYEKNISIILERDLKMEDTHFKENEDVIVVGIKFTSLSNRTKNKEVDKDLQVAMIQYVLHEYFHSFDKEILKEPEQDILKTLDVVVNEINFELYNENHTISLHEIDVERKSWDILWKVCEKHLDISKIEFNKIVEKEFFSEDNEFNKSGKRKIFTKIKDLVKDKTIDSVLDELEKIEEESRKTKRVNSWKDLSGCIAAHIADDISKIKNPKEQGKVILEQLYLNGNRKVKEKLDELIKEFPKIENIIKNRERKIEPLEG